MSYIIPDPRWEQPALLTPGRKPTGKVEIDWSSPLAKGLVSCFIVGNNGQWYDVAGLSAVVSTQSDAVITQYGAARDFGTNEKDILSKTTRLNLNQGTGGGIFVVADIDALSNYSALVSSMQSTTTQGWELRGSETTTNGEITLVRATTNFKQNSAVGALLSAVENNRILATWDTNEITQESELYCNGVKASSVSVAGSGTGDMTSTTNNIYIGQRQGGTTSLDGKIRLVVLWDRYITEPEYQSLNINPYQFLIPAG